jgi:hypothetical protein
MTTIEEIDLQHMDYLLTNNANVMTYQFKPGKYQTYGAARKAMRSLMEAIGYESLTQKQKEVVGRWNLISDQTELDYLFKTEEQDGINRLFISHTNCLVSSKLKTIKKSSYYTVDQVNYDGAMFDEIHKIKVISRATNGSTTYGVRIYDVTSREVVAEKSDLTNDKTQINDLGTILYQPTSDTILDIQIKVVSGNGRTRYESCSVCFLI